jgi:TonB family protein
VPPPPAAPAPRPAAPPAPAPPAPAPLIVSNVALGGGVQVETGTTSNLYGDPRADRRGWRAPPPAPPAGEARAPAARRVVVKPPVIRADARGSYPPQHRDLGRVVRVELLLDIDATGAVTRVHVARGELPAFDAEARATGARLRFHPATRDGVAIAYQLRWTIVFIPEGT